MFPQISHYIIELKKLKVYLMTIGCLVSKGTKKEFSVSMEFRNWEGGVVVLVTEDGL
jgi:hypothetical protein